MIHAKSADGVVHEFPDGTPDDVIDRAMQGYAKQAYGGQKPKRGAFGEVFGGAQNLFRSIPFMDEGAAALDTGLRVATGQAKSIPEGWKQSRDLQNVNADDFANRRPTTTAVIKGTGGSAGMLVPGGQGVNVFANAGRLGNMARGAVTAAGTAYAYGASENGSLAERGRAGTRAATNPLVLGLGAAGGAVAPARVKPKRARTVGEDQQLLAREGVSLTPGQMGGRVRKTAEDAATSLPFVGDAVAARRTEGIQTFNRAVVNRALKPIGETLPDDIATGADAVKHAGDRLSKGYEDAIPGKIVRADPGFAEDARKAFANVDTMTPAGVTKLQEILDQRVTSRLPANGSMDGALYKQIQSELDYEAGRFTKSTDPDHQAIGQAIVGVQKALEKAARRQDPQFAAKINALDRGWAELGRIEAAAAKSSDLSGTFTPPQYVQSIRAADGRVRRRGVARGEALSQDLAGAAARVLPSKLPDSGTAGRAAWGMVASAPGAVVGALTGGGLGALGGISATAGSLAALSRLYTPEAVQAANAALSTRLPGGTRDRALQDLAAMAKQNPKVRELYAQVAARLSSGAGASAGAASGGNVFAQP